MNKKIVIATRIISSLMERASNMR